MVRAEAATLKHAALLRELEGGAPDVGTEAASHPALARVVMARSTQCDVVLGTRLSAISTSTHDVLLVPGRPIGLRLENLSPKYTSVFSGFHHGVGALVAS